MLTKGGNELKMCNVERKRKTLI